MGLESAIVTPLMLTELACISQLVEFRQSTQRGSAQTGKENVLMNSFSSLNCKANLLSGRILFSAPISRRFLKF